VSVSEWREVTLGDVCDSVSNTHPFEKAKLIFLNTSDVYDGSILHNNYSPVAEMPGQAKKSIKKGDILYSEIRPKNKRYAMVNFDASDYVVSTKFMVIRSNGLIVNKFLYLYLTSNEVLETLQQVAEARSGTFPQITFSQVAELKLNLPPIPEQKAIVATLSALDDMIELNNKINKTLEEMAQTIFKSWFVDFEPFKDGEFEESELGLIPKGWRVVELNDISKDIICGKTPSTKDNDNYGNKMPFITIPDMHGNVFITKTERCLSQKGINIQKNKTLPKFSVCVSCIATPGLVAITSEESQTNQQINSVICKDNISCFYVYLFLNTIKDTIITLGSGGSTTLNLNKRQFSKIKIIKCDDRTMRAFHNLVKPLFFNILDNQIENQNLSEIRDTLLPKLMSGEIRVPVEDVV